MPLVSRSHIVAAFYLDIDTSRFLHDADQIMSEMQPFRKLHDCLSGYQSYLHDADQIMSEMHPFRKLHDCLRFVSCSHGTDQMLHQVQMTIGSDATM